MLESGWGGWVAEPRRREATTGAFPSVGLTGGGKHAEASVGRASARIPQRTSRVLLRLPLRRGALGAAHSLVAPVSRIGPLPAAPTSSAFGGLIAHFGKAVETPSRRGDTNDTYEGDLQSPKTAPRTHDAQDRASAHIGRVSACIGLRQWSRRDARGHG